jgi:putative transposase
MQFEQSHLYHIYNRGNNSQKIFFNRENYLFFLDKIKKNILPHADILSWCLMPSHFHLMVHVNNVEVVISEQVISEQVTQSHLLTKRRSLNDSISIILRSYTRAIQKQENLTGSLFQNRTEASCLTQMEGISPAWFQSNFGAIINISDPAKEYPQICFDYIHANPVKDGFVKI